MSLQMACCCGCKISDCLSGDTIDSGCCHGCDDLLLWCERPGWSVTQQYASTGFGPGAPSCQWNYTVTQTGAEPVQAIYRYYGQRWRCAIPPTTPETLYDVPERCPPDYPNYGLQPLCYDPSLYLCGGSTAHCNSPFATACLCSTTWLTPWRKYLLGNDPASKWLIEMTCFKNGQALGGAVNSLYDEFLCLVHREHWWRIPSGDCPPDAYIHVPGCVGGTCTGGCGDTTWQTDDLVPKWWIFACSGAPLFRFDLDDAVARGYISSADRTTALTAIGLGNQPPQPILEALSRGGYFDTRDWRADQRQAFVELDARFPGAGYAACVQACASMGLLGPIRRRLTAPYTNPPTVVPWLNRDDAEASQQALNPGAACFIDYPGAAGSAADYAYWAERQWVYFRAAPGGWVWAGWAAGSDPACSGMTEEEAILQGCGRADPTCIEALKGNPLPSPCCTDNTPVCDTEIWEPCSGCGDPGDCPCGVAPIVGCGPFSPTPIATQCENFVVSPGCLGVRFVYAQYANENRLTSTEEGCEQSYRYRCLYTARSYLVEARRSADSWDASCPFQCRREVPPQGVFNAWPAVTQGHYGIAPICDSIIENTGEYAASDLCCSGFCWDYRYVPPLPDPLAYPCLEPVGATNDCAATTECPPHSTGPQLACIGFTPSCTP